MKTPLEYDPCRAISDERQSCRARFDWQAEVVAECDDLGYRMKPAVFTEDRIEVDHLADIRSEGIEPDCCAERKQFTVET
jgi:hypothetical protein